jgi:hypothetical protein
MQIPRFRILRIKHMKYNGVTLRYHTVPLQGILVKNHKNPSYIAIWCMHKETLHDRARPLSSSRLLMHDVPWGANLSSHHLYALICLIHHTIVAQRHVLWTSSQSSTTNVHPHNPLLDCPHKPAVMGIDSVNKKKE